MSHHSARVAWQRREGEAFTDNRYSRAHRWLFDGGAEIAASASPDIVPLPFSATENVDPEEALVAALSSCHMLFFLSLAAGRDLVIDDYVDDAVGQMETVDGKTLMTRVTLRPRVHFSGATRPDRAMIEELHHRAHELCFIANSVKTEVVTEISD